MTWRGLCGMLWSSTENAEGAKAQAFKALWGQKEILLDIALLNWKLDSITRADW